MRIDVIKSDGNKANGGFISNGVTLTGPLILSGPHTDNLHAVPKQYVDDAANNLNANNITSGVLSVARLPAFTGDATTVIGTNSIVLANTGVTPGTIIKPTVDAKGRVLAGGSLVESDISGISFEKFSVGLPTTLNGYGITDAISISNDSTMQGNLILIDNPTSNNHAATKNYVDTELSLADGISVGDIIQKPYTTTPPGFLKCNGAEVDKTTYANLYAVIGDSFRVDIMPGSGQPWRQQYQINTTQSTNITGWVSNTPLPGPLTYSQAIITKNRVYLLGGYNGSAVINTVYTAPINPDGTLGVWTTGTPLPGALALSQAIVTNNRVYLLGGWIGGAYTNIVYTAPINADGTLGAWTTGTPLPGALGESQAIVTKNRVYLLGGVNGSAYTNVVYTAPINADGTLGAWTTGTPLPLTVALPHAIVTKNRVYLLGSWSNIVFIAPINPDGTLGAWSISTPLPEVLTASQAIVTKNRVYLLGGRNGSSININTVYTAPINADGTLGAWTTGTPLPGELEWSQAIVTSSKVYLFGGYNTSTVTSTVYSANISGGLNDYSPYYGTTNTINTNNYMMPGSGRPWQQQYQINTTQATDITGWVTDTPLPTGLSDSQTIVTKNRVYLLGGYDGNIIINTVYTAPINADGTLGTWTTGTPLPITLIESQAIVTKNRVYLLGYDGVQYTNNIYTAPINADGTLGTWTTDTPLPGILGQSQAIVTKNRVYLLGGRITNVYVNTVYTAPINADGTLGTWSTGTPLPVTLGLSQAIVTNNRVYLLSGYDGAQYTNNIYTAPINADGTLGAWSIDTPLPVALGWSQAIVTKNRVYLLGGYDDNTVFNTVYTAPINADGTLGTWTTGTPLPNSLYSAQIFVTNNKVYLAGGYDNSTAVSTVYSANISGGLNDYSPYYDGTIQPVDTTNLFALPDYSSFDKEFGGFITSYIKF